MKSLMLSSCVLVMSATLASAAFLSGTETFEGFGANSPLTGPGSVGGTWASANVIVTNSGAYAGNNAAFFEGVASATNTISVPAPSKAWTDFRIKPALGVAPNNPPLTSASTLFFFNAAGAIEVHNGTEWVACTNDIYGTNVSEITGADYVRVSVYQNFGSKTFAIMLNDVVIVQDVPFTKDTILAYNSFVVQNVDSNAYVDNLWVKTAVPADFTPAGQTIANHIDASGYAVRALYVDSATEKSAPYFTTIQAALDAYRTGDSISIAAGTYAENITVSKTVTLLGDAFSVTSIAVTGTGHLTLSSAATVSDAITVATSGSLVGTSATAGSASIAGTATFSGTLGITGLLDVPGTLTATGATTAGSASIAGTATFNGDFDASGAVAVTGHLNLNQTGSSAGSLAASSSGTVTLGSSVELTVAGIVDLSGTGSVLIGSGKLMANDIDMAGTSKIVSVSGELKDVVNEINVTGEFTISGSWPATVVASRFPFVDNFDGYTVGQKVNKLKAFGWNADSDSVIVQSTVNVSGKAIILPDGTAASNSVAGTGHDTVWTDYYLRPSPGAAPSANASGSFMSYVKDDGYLAVSVKEDGVTNWVTCDTTVSNAPVTPFSSNMFTRVTVCQNFTKKTFAVFIGSTNLVLHGKTFPADSASYSSFFIGNSSSATDAYLDNVRIEAYLPEIIPAGDSVLLYSDVDNDGRNDAEEIHWFGDLVTWAGTRGSIFRFM